MGESSPLVIIVAPCVCSKYPISFVLTPIGCQCVHASGVVRGVANPSVCDMKCLLRQSRLSGGRHHSQYDLFRSLYRMMRFTIFASKDRGGPGVMVLCQYPRSFAMSQSCRRVIRRSMVMVPTHLPSPLYTHAVVLLPCCLVFSSQVSVSLTSIIFHSLVGRMDMIYF